MKLPASWEGMTNDYLYKVLYRTYHTTRNSCITNQITLLNEVLEEERKIDEYHALFGWKVMRTLQSFLPRKILKTFRKHNLVANELLLSCPEGVLQYLEREFPHDSEVLSDDRNRVFDKLYSD